MRSMRRALPPPWLFAIAAAPYGSFNGLVAVALPYVLRRHGIPVDHIAKIGALVSAPTIWYFLWAPVVDVGVRRRTWAILLSVASAVCCALAIGADNSPSVRRLTILLVAGSVFAQPISSAIGGLVATVMPNHLRGRTGGWSQAGIIASGVLAGGVTVWLSGHASASVTSLVAASFVGVPAFAVLAVDEPPPGNAKLGAHLASMVRDVAATLRRRDVRLGLVFFLSPISAGALMNLFSAVAADFHATTATVLWVVAIAGVMTPVGALVGGVVCDRYDRWRVYPAAGLISALAAGATLLAPLRPATYLAGAAGYALATGFGYAAFMALALELTGSNTIASGTRFTLFMAASNAPVVYMLRLDGWGHAHFGVRGMLAVDALANAVFGAIFLGVHCRADPILPDRAGASSARRRWRPGG
jgi:MFS transporter, PAT family, beta-lactamase induction signal transducer AmpG